MSSEGGPPARKIVAEDSEAITTVIIRAVAAISNKPPSELPPLFDAVNTDAVEALVGRSKGDDPTPNLTVEFEYADYEITVFGDRKISIRESDDSSGWVTGY